MILLILGLLGLCLGSFINALVWRLHEQEETGHKGKTTKQQPNLSITKGRSICPNCKQQLATIDLIPVLSWLMLGGKCKYCKKPISPQYPIVELATACLFVISYAYWPQDLQGLDILIFALWLPILTGLIALIVYDFKWMLLPNRIVYPLSLLASIFALLSISASTRPLKASISTILAVVVGGGIFYVIYQVSDGKWIGGGDVKLGWMLGLLVGTPARAFLMIFLAALGGSLISIPLLASGKLKRESTIPFGPFLIISTIIVVLFGSDILTWYQHTILTL